MSKNRRRRARRAKAHFPKTRVVVDESLLVEEKEDDEVEIKGEETPKAEAAPQEQEQEQEQTEEQEETTEEIPEVSFPLITSHINKGKLHTSAMCLTPEGAFLVHCRTRCRHPAQGAVNVNGETLAPVIRETLSVHEHILTGKAIEEKQKRKAGELVERAREGDQNAMAIIACVRDNASSGNPRAKQSFVFLKEYIDKHPATPNVGVEAVKNNHDNWESIMVANGAPISRRSLHHVAHTLGPYRVSFMCGFQHWMHKHKLEHDMLKRRLSNIERQLVRIGRIVGKAHALQGVRSGRLPISAYSADVGWELGE